MVGVSSLTAAHLRHLPRLAELLRANGARDTLLIAGGVVPEEDIPALQAAGVSKVFTMGSDTRDIVAYLRTWWATREGSQ